jgi:hypothetical protein
VIIRYGGGNDGIKDYLENGRKVDRHFSRDELDKRVPIEGDLNVTNAVINAIEDHGQERYLHISMSFNEPDITEEKMAEVFQQYKRELMTAYGDDEYNIYAEIHWPKIKESYNHQTEQMEPRYPHLHIVVPKRNLLTGGFLDPCSMQQRSLKYFDAIQEKLNRDNGLSSPRESPRVGNNHYEAALGRYKDKEFRSKNGELKRDIYNAILDRDVRSVDEFKSLLNEFGEVKTRNLGKPNEYFAIRLPDDKKFTNLKANIFDRAFIEKRSLIIDPITDAQVSKRVETWREIRSKEIKFISNASPKTKDHYKSLTLPERREYLAQREADYEQGYRGQTSRDQSEKRRSLKQTKLSSLLAGDYEPGNFEFGRGTPTEGEGDLHELRESSMGHFGGADGAPDQLFLSNDEAGDIQHLQAEGDSGLRHNLYSGSGGGSRSEQIADTTDPQSSVLGSLIAAEVENRQKANDLQRFAEIRKNLDPNHLLAYAQIKFGVDPDKHPVSTARDGSPRIKAGKTNLNVSDFLTKHIGLEWSEASEILIELYDKQQRGIVDKPKSKVAHIDDWRRFRDEIYPKNVRTYDELKNQIKVSYSLGLKSINSEFFARRKQIANDSALSRTDKHYFRSVVILEKLQKVETLQTRVKEQDSLTNRVKYPYSTLFYDFATKNEVINMKVLDDLKRRFNTPAPDSENSIGAPFPRTPNHMPSGAEAAKRARLIASLKNQERELKALKIRITDLRPSPLATGAVAFHHKEHGKQIFVNHPDRVELNRAADQDEVAVGMIYAIERFGSPLDIKGTAEFKDHIVTVAAERDMDITFTDEALNRALQAKRLELGMEPLQGNEITVPELQLDPAMPKEQAVDKALMGSKVAELDAINQAFAAAPSVGVERDLRQASVADALQRHDEIQSGFVDDDRVQEIAKADLEAWTYLEGRPEQQQLALSIAAAMENEDYSGYMDKNAPAEFKLTLDAAQFMASRDAGITPTATPTATPAAAATVPEEPQAEAARPLTAEEMANLGNLARLMATQEATLIAEVQQMRMAGSAQEQIDERETELASLQSDRAETLLQFLPQLREQEVQAGAAPERVQRLDTEIEQAQATFGQAQAALEAARLGNLARLMAAQEATLTAEVQQMRTAGSAQEQIDERETELASLQSDIAETLKMQAQATLEARSTNAPVPDAPEPATTAMESADVAQPAVAETERQIRFIRPDMVTAIEQEQRMSAEFSRMDRQPENFTNWPDAVSMAARLHNDYDLKPRDENYTDNMAAISIEAWEYASRDQGGPDELFGQDKAFHMDALVQDMAELADNNRQYEWYINSYAPSALRNEIRQYAQIDQERAEEARADRVADEELLDSQIEQPPVEQTKTIESEIARLEGIQQADVPAEQLAIIDRAHERLVSLESLPEPSRSAESAQAAVEDIQALEDMAGEPGELFMAQTVNDGLSRNVAYRESADELVTNDLIAVIEASKVIEQQRILAKEDRKLDDSSKMETTPELSASLIPGMPEFTHNGERATLDLSRFEPQPQVQQPAANAPEPTAPVMPAMPEFTHNGERATLDLSRFDQQPETQQPTAPEPLSFTHNGEPATIDLSRFQPQSEVQQPAAATPDRVAVQGVPAGWDESLNGEFSQEHFDGYVARAVSDEPLRTSQLTDSEIYDEYVASQFENTGDDARYWNDQAIAERSPELTEALAREASAPYKFTVENEPATFNADRADIRLAHLSPEVANKVIELEAVNSKYENAEMTNAGAVDSIVTKGTVIDAAQRHESLAAGTGEPHQVREVAEKDLSDFAYLQGKPEQQELARSMAAMMENPGYRDYMRENAPLDVHVTMEASQFVAEQSKTADMAGPDKANDKDMEM